MTTSIVIPVRDNLHLTQSICNQLLDQGGWEYLHIFDNGSDDDTWQYLNDMAYMDSRIQPWFSPYKTIYEMWSMGFDFSVEDGATKVAILNNDIVLSPGLIGAMGDVLQATSEVGIVYPDYNRSIEQGVDPQLPYYTRGTYRHGGMSGFCFMLRVKAVTWSPLVDPNLRLWYGDDDIAFSMEAAGWQQMRLAGWPLDHIGQATCNQHPEVFKDVPADKAYFEKKWGRGK